MENNELQFADEVWHRIVQIVQEAMLTGVDCTDLLRQIRVKSVKNISDGSDLLYLTEEYRKFVRDQHQKLLEEAIVKQSEQANQKHKIVG